MTVRGMSYTTLGETRMASARRPALSRTASLAVASLVGLMSLYYVKTTSELSGTTAYTAQGSLRLTSKAVILPEGALLLHPDKTAELGHVINSLEEDLKLLDEEVPPDFLPSKIRTPYGELPDRRQVVNATCPRYVTMMKPPHGLGHQIGTMTTALITALFLNLTFVQSPFIDDSWHGAYPGIAKFTGLSEGEALLSDVESTVKQVIDVHSPKEPFSEDLVELYEPLRKSIMDEHGSACHVLFRVAEYYSYDYGSFTKAIMSRKFRDAPERGHVPLLYDSDHFIIAIHIRVGDIQPTAEGYFKRVLSQVLPAVRAHNVTYHVHIFAESRKPEDFPSLLSHLGSDSLSFHGDLTPFESFYHLTQPHVLIMSASGFSQFSCILGTRALCFSPPSREKFPLKFCPPGAVCCQADGGFEQEGLVRLHWRVQRWVTYRRRMEDLRMLREMVGMEGEGRIGRVGLDGEGQAAAATATA